MVSVVKSLFLLSKSARDFFSMKEIRASRGGRESFFVCVVFVNFFFFLFFFVVGTFLFFCPKNTKNFKVEKF